MARFRADQKCCGSRRECSCGLTHSGSPPRVTEVWHGIRSCQGVMLNSLLFPAALFSAIAALGLVFPVPNLTNAVPMEIRPVREALHVDEWSKDLVVEETLASFKNRFRCTIYYTPKETGFTSDAGFDLTPETRSGLDQRVFPRDFLLAVQKEGYGRMKEPVEGHSYISYHRSEWRFADAPLDCSGKPLIAKRSCAVKTGHKLIRPQTKFKVCGSSVPPEFDELRWIVSDTGSALDDGQVDLYWGEEDPSGPGKGITFPKGCRSTIDQTTVIVLR